MKTTSFWDRLKAKYERKGGTIQVTRQAVSLGSAHATTGIYAPAYTESNIDMIIISEREVKVHTPAGDMHYIESIAYTDTHVVAGDRIKLYSALAQEKIDNGGFEDDFTSWTQGGTPKIETTIVHSGSKSCELESIESVDQTLADPASTAEMLNSLTLYEVQTVTPSTIATVTTHYVVKLIRLHEPVNFGSATFWWYINNSTYYDPINGKWKVTVTYTDDTTTVINYDETVPAYTAEWTQEDITDLLDGTKIIANIKIERVASQADIYFDDVSILA